MPIKNVVVAHFLDGRIEKGITLDFFPHRPIFHIVSSDDQSAETGSLVRFTDLKALFFVRNLDGNPQRTDLRGFIGGPVETIHGRKIAIRFPDGELICGYTLGYAPHRDGFFMFPADQGSNNLRVFVITQAAAEIRRESQADELAQRVLKTEAA